VGLLELVFAVCDYAHLPRGARMHALIAWCSIMAGFGAIVWWPRGRVSTNALMVFGMIALAAGALLVVARRVERPRGVGVAGLRLIPRRGSVR